MTYSAALVASVAFFALLVCSPGAAQTESSAVSEDGTQQGSIQFSEDNQRGSVSSSSVGGNRASASSSLTIGPSGTQASFSAQGDNQSVSRTVVVDESSSSFDGVASSRSEVTDAGATFTGPAESTEVMNKPMKKAEEEEEPAEPEAADRIIPRTAFESESAQEDQNKICVINNQEEFERQLDLGKEVTHVLPYGDSIEIVTQLRSPYSSSRTSVVTKYIPESIHRRCGVTYADLGFEDREDEGYSTLSTSQHSSYHFSSNTDPNAEASADYIRESVLKSLCSQEFFRTFALYLECSDHATKQPW